ncbi:peptide/nickel transport system permease protein [Agreia bicolorata]|uniref:ABC transporter permease n=1 Tax=Agreia bicolorata TaxID=110935 RepID=A0A1T4WTT9_9MICO|nr:ABC transporter permease [Agreia bicolorata]KJC64226.1 ABC transporter permease [Agreia bicolorata]SKA80285.1 peptide/nickel transport system permease protein [Agreia bicolorata]
MAAYILRRFVAGIVLAVLVTFITYLLLATTFDSVVRALLGPAGTDETVAAKTTQLGWDRPILVQYGDWLLHAVQGDLGRSLFTSEPVIPAVSQRLSVTLSIVLVALVLSVLLSIVLGVTAAVRGGIVDRLAQGISLVGMLIPGLLLSIGLVLVFAITLKVLPATGYTAPGDDFGRYLAAITIPVFVLVVAGTASMSAQVRGAMIGELRKDYVRTLEARGLSRRAIILKHVLRNAAAPAVTVLGFEFITMLGGAIFIEKVFALPGYGTFSLNSALRGDVPVILGITAFSVMLVVFVNLLVDLAIGWLTPKARML